MIHFFKTKSLTLRLSLLMLAGMLITLLLASSAIYLLLRINADHVAQNFLQNEINVISNLLEDHPDDQAALDQEIVWEPQSNHYQFFAQISTSSGSVLQATPKINIIPLDAWPSLRANSDFSKMQMIKLASTTYALMTARVYKLKQPLLVHVAYNITAQEEMLEAFATDLLVLTLLGVLLALLLSFPLIKWGLKPVDKFVKQIEVLDLQNLSALDIELTFKEFQPLIEAFNRLLARIKQGYERLSAFSSDLAHELRTPINNLMLATEVLLAQPESYHKILELLASHLEEYRRIATIIDKLLFLARSDARSLNLHKQALLAHAEIQAVVDFYEASAAEKNIQLEVEGEAKLQADQTLLRNALSNVIGNAIKYSQMGAKVLIRVQDEPHCVKILVKDNGPGIAKEHLAHITERFYRGEDQDNLDLLGSGLGLAIVKSIMEAHRGSVHIYGNEPRGTIVELMFLKLALH